MDGAPIKADSHQPPMIDPIAYFLTWVTYGTWLPGDQRGWVEYKRGWKLPSPRLELECKARMQGQAVLLNQEDRGLVEHQVAETCQYRHWKLYAVNCRSNHIHVVVSAANVPATKIRVDMKAWTTRRLRSHSSNTHKSWWAECGSIRWIWNKQSLATVVQYTLDTQDRHLRNQS